MLSFEKHIHTLNNGNGLLEGLLCFYDLTDSDQVSSIENARDYIKKASLLYLEETENKLRETQEGFAEKVKKKNALIPEIDKAWVHQEIKDYISRAVCELKALPHNTKPDYLDDFIKELSSILEDKEQKFTISEHSHSIDDSLSNIVSLLCEMEG